MPLGSGSVQLDSGTGGAPLYRGMSNHRLLCLEAALALSLARLLLALLPLRLLVGWTMAPQARQDGAVTDARRLGRARRVRLGLALMAPRLPWHSNCLTQALAGRWMLRRRGLAGVIHVGVHRHTGVLAAHAWLTWGDQTVCGGGEAPAFQTIARFQGRRQGEEAGHGR